MDLAAAEEDLAAAEGSDVGGYEGGASGAGDERAQEENRARARGNGGTERARKLAAAAQGIRAS